MVATVKLKLLFFDSPKVLRAVDRAKRRSLSRAGAFIRTRARTSIRKRKAVSAPGKPPSSHEGSLRKRIFFSFDRRSDSVVVGPVGFRRSRVPDVLEHGGRTVVSRFDVKRKKLVKTRVAIKARPFMRPAIEKEQANIPKAWANSVRRF